MAKIERPIDAHPVLFKMGDGAQSEGFDAIAEVMDITGPEMSREAIDTTSHNRTGWTSYIGGIKDGGTITFDINMRPAFAQHDGRTGLLKAFEDGEARNYQIEFPDDTNASDNTVWQVSAIVTGLSPNLPVRGAVMASVTLQVTGVPTFTYS